MTKTFTFQNVSISVDAESGQEAYTKLCNALSGVASEWNTDSYTIEGESEEPRDTSELFPAV